VTTVPVRSVTGSLVTLQDGVTSVGTWPILLDNLSQNYVQGIETGTITVISWEAYVLITSAHQVITHPTQTISYTQIPSASTSYVFAFPILTIGCTNRKVGLGVLGDSQTESPVGDYVSVALAVQLSSWLGGVTAGQDVTAIINHSRFMDFTSAIANIASRYFATFDSNDANQLQQLGDTLLVKVTTGATPPPSGVLTVDVVEVL